MMKKYFKNKRKIILIYTINYKKLKYKKLIKKKEGINMDIENQLNNEKNINNNVEIEKEQKNFLETTIGKIVNTGLDIGIRALLPDFIDEQVINLKDNLFEYGFKDGVTKTIDDAINLGKSAIGIFTGNFENIEQMQSAVQNGGLIDGLSDLLDTVVGKVSQKGLINSNVANILTQGKDIILDNVQSNIEKTFTEQITNSNNINQYINDWKNAFENKDFNTMEIQYEKIETELKELAPIENTINQARTIENLHNLIKNNGQDFNLTKEQLELAEKLK